MLWRLVMFRLLLVLLLWSPARGRIGAWGPRVVRVRGGEVASSTGNVTTNTVAVNHTESLIRRFDAAMSGEAILQLAEEITAIRRCTDKAMRLAKADYADAVLAAHAIQRLANVTSTGPTIDWTPSALDRRFEQLTECVELRAAQLPTITLSRYCWALSVLRIADEEQVDCVFDEYTCRLQNRGANINSSSSSKSVSLTNEELAAMMWTVGCIRDTYDWARGPVVTRLASALVEVGEEGLDRLNVRILLRVLWTLSLYASEGGAEGGVDARRSLATMALHSLHRRSAELGDNSVVAALSACAKLKIHLTEIAAIAALLQRLSPLVGRLSPSEFAAAAEALSTIYSQLSGTARQAEAAQPDSPVVELVSIVEKVSSALIQAASMLRFSALPVGSIAELVHLAVLIDVVDDRTILEAGLRQVESLLAANVTLAPSDASLLLEAIALLTWTIRREKGFHTSFAQHDVNATASLGIFLSAQRLAGHMSAICSTRAPALMKRSPTDLLSAAWASACYARPCSDMMELLRAEMQNNSFALLHDVDPAGLGKVAVVVATDQKQPVSTFRGRATFDDKFLHELLPLVIGRLTEIAPAGLQVSVLTAIAEIAQGGAALAEVLNTRACVVSVDDLGKLRTSSLLKFLWAAGRLPEGLLSNETMSAAQTTLLGRNIDIGYSKGPNTAHATEFMLLARLLADAHKPNGRQDNNLIDVVLRNVLKAMAMHLPDDAAGVEGDGEGKGEMSGTGTADLVALSGIVKALIGLKVYNVELVQQCTRCIRNELAFHAAHSDDSSASCRRLYDLGRLEGLLSIYCNTVGAENNLRRGFHLFG